MSCVTHYIRLSHSVSLSLGLQNNDGIARQVMMIHNQICPKMLKFVSPNATASFLSLSITEEILLQQLRDSWKQKRTLQTDQIIIFADKRWNGSSHELFLSRVFSARRCVAPESGSCDNLITQLSGPQFIFIAFFNCACIMLQSFSTSRQPLSHSFVAQTCMSLLRNCSYIRIVYGRVLCHGRDPPV